MADAFASASGEIGAKTYDLALLDQIVHNVYGVISPMPIDLQVRRLRVIEITSLSGKRPRNS